MHASNALRPRLHYRRTKAVQKLSQLLGVVSVALPATRTFRAAKWYRTETWRQFYLKGIEAQRFKAIDEAVSTRAF
jgi:hypothetical protein